MLKNHNLLIAFAMIIIGTPAKGEEVSNKHHIELSVGEFLSSSWGLNGTFVDNKEEYFRFEQWAKASRPYTLPPEIPGYESGWIIPTFSLGYFYQILPWLEIGGEISTMSMCDTEHYLSNDEIYAHYLRSNLYIATGVRFAYYHKNITDLYSGLLLGVNIHFHSTESIPLLSTSGRFTWQVTALGVRFGKKVYGNVEVGYGYKGMLSIGIGYRF